MQRGSHNLGPRFVFVGDWWSALTWTLTRPLSRVATTGTYSDIDQSVCGMSTMSMDGCKGPDCEGCSGLRTHAGAATFCHDMGARLCLAVELEADVNIGNRGGCKLDKTQVWTGDTCDEGAGFLVVYGSTKARSAERACELPAAMYPVRCCGDAVGPQAPNEPIDITVVATQLVTRVTTTVAVSTSLVPTPTPTPTPSPTAHTVLLAPTVLPETSLPGPGVTTGTDAVNATDGYSHHMAIPPVPSTGPEHVEVNDLLGGFSAATHWQPDWASPYPKFPVQIGEVGATKSVNSIYVLGKARVGSASFFRLDLTDPSAGWEVVPNPPQLSDHHALVAVGTRIFVLGGMFWNCPRVDCLGLLQIFDTESETWSYGSPMPWVVQGKPTPPPPKQRFVHWPHLLC